jgi:uncharacterized membrane protein
MTKPSPEALATVFRTPAVTLVMALLGVGLVQALPQNPWCPLAMFSIAVVGSAMMIRWLGWIRTAAVDAGAVRLIDLGRVVAILALLGFVALLLLYIHGMGATPQPIRLEKGA